MYLFKLQLKTKRQAHNNSNFYVLNTGNLISTILYGRT